MSKVSAAFHAIAAALRGNTLPQGVDTGKIGVVLGKVEDVAHAIDNGLNDTTKAFLDHLIEQHAGFLAGPIEAVANPVIDEANGAIDKVIEGVAAKVQATVDGLEAKLTGLFGSHSAEVISGVEGVVAHFAAAAAPNPSSATAATGPAATETAADRASAKK